MTVSPTGGPRGGLETSEPPGAEPPARPLRVLMPTPRFLPDLGGVETHVSEVGRRLAERGAEVTVVCADTTGDRRRQETIDGVEVLRVPGYPRGRDWCHVPELTQVVRSRPWDLVHVQSYHTLVAPEAMFAARRQGIPYILSFHAGGHSGRLREAVRPVQQRALGPLLRGAERLVVLADFEVELYGPRLGVPRERFVSIPNGADLPIPPDDPGVERDPELIASVGRLERYKGHHRAIAALPSVIERRPGARLWIAGSGPYEDELRRTARRWGVADRVEIRAIPPTDRHAMARELSRAALVVLLSDFETHPIAALEAIALRRRVVVADNSGLSELADRGWARAVSLESPAGEIGEVMAQEMVRTPLTAAPAMPTWDDSAARLHALYLDIADRGRR